MIFNTLCCPCFFGLPWFLVHFLSTETLSERPMTLCKLVPIFVADGELSYHYNSHIDSSKYETPPFMRNLLASWEAIITWCGQLAVWTGSKPWGVVAILVQEETKLLRWCHHMAMLFPLPPLCEGNPLPWVDSHQKWPAMQSCQISCWQLEQTVEQINGLPLILDVLMLMYCHRNDKISSLLLSSLQMRVHIC